jgi:hypothetical protein
LQAASRGCIRLNRLAPPRPLRRRAGSCFSRAQPPIVSFFPSLPSRHPHSYLRHFKGRHARVAPQGLEYPSSSGKLDLARDFATRDQAALPAALDLGPFYSSHCLQARTSTCRVRSLSCSTNS